MNRYIQNGMLFFGIFMICILPAAEKLPVQWVNSTNVADAQLKEKVARYFSNRKSTMQPNNLNPVDNNLSKAKCALMQGISFRYTKMPAFQPALMQARVNNSSQGQ